MWSPKELGLSKGYWEGGKPRGARLVLGASEIGGLSSRAMGRTPFPARSLLLRRKYYLPGIVLRGETRGPWSSASLLPSGCLALFVFSAFFFFSFFFGLIVLIKSFCPVLFFTRLTMLRSAQRCFLCFWPGAGLHGAWLPVVSCRHGDSRPGGLHWGGEGVTWLTSPGEERVGG